MGEPNQTRAWWNRRHAEDSAVRGPSGWLVSLGSLVPTAGQGLDIAGGTGRNALWLAERGLSVTLLDISPMGLALAGDEASRRGLALEQVEADLEVDPLPPGPWDLVVCFHYLQRSLFDVFHEVLGEGGLLICEMATVRNLERHEHPARRHLLEEGELRALARGLTLVSYAEGWTETGQHLARLVARSGSAHPGPGPPDGRADNKCVIMSSW